MILKLVVHDPLGTTRRTRNRAFPLKRSTLDGMVATIRAPTLPKEFFTYLGGSIGLPQDLRLPISGKSPYLLSEVILGSNPE